MKHPPNRRVAPDSSGRKPRSSSRRLASYDPVALAALREAFAKAIAYREDRSVGLVGSDNTLIGWVSISDAVRSGRAFTVVVDIDVLAIDCDDPDLADGVYEIADELGAAGERPVLLESGQPGRLHLLCRVQGGVLHEQLRQRARELKLDVRTTIRPPLSPHRLGLTPGLISPADPRDALAALQPPRPRRHRDLSPRLRELIETGVHVYGSRSEPIIALADSAVNARWTLDEFRVAMERSPASAKLHGRADAETELRRVWAKAIRRVRLSPPIATRDDARHVVRAIRALADSAIWRGRAGATDKAVLEAHMRIAERTGSIQYTASVRQIAEAAGFTARTVSTSHHRLQGDWLKLVKLGRGALGSEWKLSPKNVSHLSTLTTSWGGREDSVEAGDTGLGHDVWRWGGLGPAARHVFTLLPSEGAISIKTLVQRRGTVRSAVYRLLRKLKQHGLAVQLGAGDWRRGQVDQAKLDALATHFGIAGAGQKQRWHHEDERERYRRRKRTGILKLRPADDRAARDRHPQTDEPSAKAQVIGSSPGSALIAQPACARPVQRVSDREKPRRGGRQR